MLCKNRVVCNRVFITNKYQGFKITLSSSLFKTVNRFLKLADFGASKI